MPASYRNVSIKELYEQASSDDSVSYDVFRRKLHRLLAGNKRTTNRTLRNAGVILPSSRPLSEFVAYDGEGWGTTYTLLANSYGNSIYDPNGLSTEDCLEFLADRHSHTIRVFFSFSYDVNHIIKDFSDDEIRLLLRGRTVKYKGERAEYRVSYIQGKIFTVNNIRYYDVFSFFATNFINVVKLMLGPESVTESLIEGKSGRGDFENWDPEKIIRYNAEELDLLVQIMNKLRNAFNQIGVRLTQWYGPGAVAKYWMKKYGITPNETHTPASLTGINSAYYGGRFEQPVLGRISPVYEYDLHSAYPSIMYEMPYFTKWKRRYKGEFEDNPYSVWHISFDLREDQQNDIEDGKSHNFMPLPVRDNEGRICFPVVGKGWYWYSEIKVMLDYFPRAKVIYHEGYVAETRGQPFSWIKDLYDYRQRLKSDGNLSQYAIKVGLNSLYGKTAQRVGQNPFFSISWAGYITSSTRAKLARAGYEGGSNHVLGFATDAVFTDIPFKSLPLSDNLGDWEEQEFKEATFFQSGIYRVIQQDGAIVDRYRGSPLRKGIDNIIEQIRANPTAQPRPDNPMGYPEVRVTRFISHSLAVHAPKAYQQYRLQFIQARFLMALDAPYKRHYYGLYTKYFDKNGMSQRDFGRLLTERVESSPKVFKNDNFWLTSWDYLWGNLHFNSIESEPPPMKDVNSQRLLDEAELTAIEAGYDEVPELGSLPLVEDDLK